MRPFPVKRLGILAIYGSAACYLCPRHARAVAASISQRAQALQAAGQRHAVIIATDGESTDGDVSDAMQLLQRLPVWVVVRLCTDDDQVRHEGFQRK